VDRFGAALGGSIAAFFSDMLGNHQLGVGIAANGRIQDIGGEISYVNRGDRLTWGARGGRAPIVNAFTVVGDGVMDGTPVRFVDLVIERTFIDRATGLFEYPLSQTRRFEGGIGYTRISYDREVERNVLVLGQLVDRFEIGADAPPAVGLASGSLAFVHDNSIFGFTSPVQGRRMRLEVEGNLGTLDFMTALADWRGYLFLDPLTFAVRGLHYGRYGTDAESERLSPLFLGQGTFVRGYDAFSFDGDECTEVAGRPGACPEFDRLVGSRIGVANAELRIPLFGNEQFGLFELAFLPMELVLFGDAGVAWTGDESPVFRFAERSTERVPVFSAGTSLRMNLLGYLVLEFYYARPFQRPEAGWKFGFQIAPGW
jgi:hypothetical protein